MLARLTAPAMVVLLLVSGCTPGQADGEAAAASMTAPVLGDCRVLTPEDIAKPDNDSPVVDCAAEHTAETFAIGSFPDDLRADVGSRELGAYVYRTCKQRFGRFLGGEESTVMRSMFTWAWFRPSPAAWEQGARWYRCDVVGGGEQAKSFVHLPETAQGVLLGRPDDRWMVCVDGPSVSGAVKIPCTQPHTWRAATTIVLGKPADAYPGDRVVEVRTRDFCSDSVGAWLNYPVDFDYGYTWFHEAEWKAGNRRSICWARTDE